MSHHSSHALPSQATWMLEPLFPSVCFSTLAAWSLMSSFLGQQGPFNYYTFLCYPWGHVDGLALLNHASVTTWSPWKAHVNKRCCPNFKSPPQIWIRFQLGPCLDIQVLHWNLWRQSSQTVQQLLKLELRQHAGRTSEDVIITVFGTQHCQRHMLPNSA